MCRLLAVVTNEPTDFRLSLHEAPRSLSKLSQEHPHGWGVAVHSSEAGWTVQKEAGCAHGDERFHQAAHGSHGEVLIAHVRKATIGATSLRNTHPFREGRWVFAHNGTIAELPWLRGAVSTERARRVGGETDSELLFALLLSRLDAAGVTEAPASPVTDAVLLEITRELLARPAFGASNFLLSDGSTCYAHRSGRTLFLLDRVPGDRVRVRRESVETGAVIETPWSPARRAILIASENITDEPWLPVDEGALLRIDRLPLPGWQRLG